MYIFCIHWRDPEKMSGLSTWLKPPLYIPPQLKTKGVGLRSQLWEVTGKAQQQG